MATSRLYYVRTLRRRHSLLCARRSKKKMIQEKDMPQLTDYQSLLSCGGMRKYVNVGLLVDEYIIIIHRHHYL